MKLYHGSLEIVTRPEIRQPDRPLDYGAGFYATSSAGQAADWVRRRMGERHTATGYVCQYEYDETKAAGLNIATFDEPTQEWVDFVMANRMQENFHHGYDIVHGPVANDRVYASFSLYEGGTIDAEQLIAALKTFRLVDQYLFHTAQSLRTLTFLKSETISK